MTPRVFCDHGGIGLVCLKALYSAAVLDGIGTFDPYVKTFAVKPFAQSLTALSCIFSAEQPICLGMVYRMALYPFYELAVTFLIIGKGSELTLAKLFQPDGFYDGCIK